MLLPKNKPQDLKLVVFDFDGTLADTKQGIIHVVKQSLQALGLSVDPSLDLSALVGPPFPEAFCEVLGFTQQQAEAMTLHFREHYPKLPPTWWPLFDGIVPLLEELKASGMQLGIASSKRHELLTSMLHAHKIYELFDFPYGKRFDGKDTKANTLGRVLQASACPPEQACMVGDRKYDVQAAYSQQVKCIGCLYGNTTDRVELEAAGAHYIVKNVQELHDLLLKN